MAHFIFLWNGRRNGRGLVDDWTKMGKNVDEGEGLGIWMEIAPNGKVNAKKENGQMAGLGEMNNVKVGGMGELAEGKMLTNKWTLVQRTN